MRRGGRPAPQVRSRWRRWAPRVAVAVVGLVALVALDAALAMRRVDRTSVERPVIDDGATTWLLIGTDDRGDGGPRADLVVLVRITDLATSALTLSPELGIPGFGSDWTMADALDAGGLQPVVNGVCSELGLAVDHVAVVDMPGLAESVDAAGGVDVAIPVLLRDPSTGLEPVEEGIAHLDGDQALALVRSRAPEIVVDDEWVPSVPDEAARAERGTQVLFSLGARATPSALHPVRTHRVAWSLSDSLTLTANTGVGDLLALFDAMALFQTYDEEGIEDLPLRRRGGLSVPSPTALRVLRSLDEGEDPFRPDPCPNP